MITTTHVVTNALVTLRRRPPALLATRGRRWSFIAGGLAPDVGLMVMSVGAAIYYPWLRDLSLEQTFRLVYDDLFFTEPIWIAAHNMLHAPLVIAALYLIGRRSTRRWAAPLKAFAAGCALHTAMDIPVHHDDGPLILWPLNWTLRFQSPVSYWDPAHYGNIVGPIDVGITVLGSAALLVAWLRRRRANKKDPVVV